MKKILALFSGLVLCIAAPRIVSAQYQAATIILGHSGGAGLVSDLRRVIERDKIWEKYGLNVKAVYFNSGSVLTQAMAGGNIVASDSDVPAMLNLSISGVTDVKLVAVTINPSSISLLCEKILRSRKISRGKESP
jgi:ABC-type nitrate/sulfonate/bicarbonate transport system substrate-binding protein